ncbi:hypothetical protein [Pyxidicoccus xibeiensis]|uniref:hypothetical protein n=1 Tax=Pyxidicoccus xibeiensis TaxID=2906759 RepID=UPI0020A746F6|nr:hypothetical protein [Pyxidicoccus xibeiensis]MCP3139789.1 hypothetical protein [Pyxidicoccus xibeiensis]
MLTQQQREFVEEQLVAVVSLHGSPRATIAAVMGGLASKLPDGLVPEVLVTRAVDICIADAYGSTPPALVMLLGLIKHIAGIADIVAAIGTVPLATGATPNDPFSALILDNKLPFLDRQPARAFLRALTQPMPMQPVVVVSGNQKSGKSYTSEFVDHLCRNLPGIQHCRIEVTHDQGASVGPAELARDLVTQLGGNPWQGPPQNTNLDRWAQELANWVLAEAKQSGVRWWFVLDGFNKKELRSDTSLLIVKLAKGLTTGYARLWHRLILLDFDRTVLPLQPGTIAAESTAGIPASAVAAGIAEVVKASGKAVDEKRILDKLMDGLPDPVVDLPELGSRFRDLITVIAP